MMGLLTKYSSSKTIRRKVGKPYGWYRMNHLEICYDIVSYEKLTVSSN
jgi:hypothetical protein